MPWRFSNLGCNRQWDETAGGLPTRRANDWIAEKRSPVICVARSRVCRDGRGMKGCPSSCHQHARGVTVYPYREKLDEWWRGAQVQSIGC